LDFEEEQRIPGDNRLNGSFQIFVIEIPGDGGPSKKSLVF
jgi:hypothetical protein